jgi:hypothetical protein
MAVVLSWARDSRTDKASRSWISWQSNACWECHSYFSELTKVKFANVRNSMDGDSSVFKDMCLHWVNIFFCLVCWWTLWVLDGFSRGHTVFELGKPLGNLYSSPFLLYKSHFKSFKHFCSMFSQFKAKFYTDMQFLQVWLFPGIPKLEIYKHTFLDFKLSPCVKCNMFSFGCFPDIWVLIADVSEHSIGSIFKGSLMKYDRGWDVWGIYTGPGSGRLVVEPMGRWVAG